MRGYQANLKIRQGNLGRRLPLASLRRKMRGYGTIFMFPVNIGPGALPLASLRRKSGGYAMGFDISGAGSVVILPLASLRRKMRGYGDIFMFPVNLGPGALPLASLRTFLQEYVMKIIMWILGTVVGGFVLMVIIGSTIADTPDARTKLHQRDAIKYCWKDQAKKSLDPDAARFLAGACEKMESDFHAQWGYEP